MTTNTILDAFESTFTKARATVFETMQKFTMDTAGSQQAERTTDVKLALDKAVQQLYLEVAAQYRMFVVAEES